MLQRDTFYPVVGRIPYDQRVTLGLDNNFYNKGVHALWTGEKRCPRKGEWYFSGAIIEAYCAPNDLTTPYHIARLVKTKTETVTHILVEGKS